MFYKSLPRLVDRNLCLKIIILSPIFLSQYCVSTFLVWIRPQLEILLKTGKVSRIANFDAKCKLRGPSVVNFINILCERFLVLKCFFPKSFCQSQNISRKKLHKALWYETCACKICMKLTPVSFFCLLNSW